VAAKTAAAKAVTDKTALDKAAADKSVAQKTAEDAVAEKAAAEKAAVQKAASDKVEQVRVAREQKLSVDLAAAEALSKRLHGQVEGLQSAHGQLQAEHATVLAECVQLRTALTAVADLCAQAQREVVELQRLVAESHAHTGCERVAHDAEAELANATRPRATSASLTVPAAAVMTTSTVDDDEKGVVACVDVSGCLATSTSSTASTAAVIVRDAVPLASDVSTSIPSTRDPLEPETVSVAQPTHVDVSTLSLSTSITTVLVSDTQLAPCGPTQWMTASMLSLSAASLSTSECIDDGQRDLAEDSGWVFLPLDESVID
jgi:hypothetical protein